MASTDCTLGIREMRERLLRWLVPFALTFTLGHCTGATLRMQGVEKSIDAGVAWALMLELIGAYEPIIDIEEGRCAQAKRNLGESLARGLSELDPNVEASAYLINDVIHWRAQLDTAQRPDAAVDNALVRIKRRHQKLLDRARLNEELSGR